MIKNTLILLLLSLLATGIFAQTDKFWTDCIESTIWAVESDRQIVPMSYRVVELNFGKMKKVLAKATTWDLAEHNQSTKLIAFPLPSGEMQHFRVVEASIFSEGLASKFPKIKSYKGWGVEDPTATIRFDVSPQGFHAMVLSAEGTWYIDPYAKGNTKNYIVYQKKDLVSKDPFTCQVEEKVAKTVLGDAPESGDCQYRTYRLALACTGEYAQFHGGAVSSVLAAMNTTMTRVNGIYEKEFAIRLILIPNNDQLIFLDAATDGYTNNSGNTMLSENQTKIDNIIGAANYDIGHVFSTGGGGIAALYSPCSGFKAQGVTGRPQPVGDGFDVDYVAHEMGHQFGGHHTQNNDCNRSATTSMEPGSGSSIMGYAGICFPNVQNSSDAYFHAINIQEVHAFITGNGNACANVTALNNAVPTVNGGLDYSIPVGTPFVLEAVANDEDGDPITYAWDQMDPEVAPMPPQANSAVGPTFRGHNPTASPKRYFPNLNAILSNNTPTWEVIPMVSRTMNFRVIVRDNHPGGGCNATDDLVVSTVAAAGPFVVTQPNTNLDWPALSSQTVLWDVANTSAAPVNAQNVDILLSMDGGLTYPITLAENAPNDGSQQVTMPSATSTTARIMVKASDNIFFDISNTNFTISEAQAGFSLNLSGTELNLCATTPSSVTLTVNSILGYAGVVNLTAVNVPSGMSVVFNPNSVTAPSSSTVSFSGTNSLVEGYHTIELKGTSSTGTLSEFITVFYSKEAPNEPSLVAPVMNATGTSVKPLLAWVLEQGVAAYQVEVYSDAALTNLVLMKNELKSNEFQLVTALNPSSTYYWRVLASNECQQSVASATFTFSTEAIFCTEISAQDVPIVIPNNSTSVKQSVIHIADAGELTSIKIKNLDISHSYINDLKIKVISPDGTEVMLLDQICGLENNLLLSFDDDAPNAYVAIPCPPIQGDTYQPKDNLASFVGKDITGDWTLEVNDLFDEDGGVINGWTLDICYYVESLTIAVEPSHVSCQGGQDGSVAVAVAGGLVPYTYSWSEGNGQNLSAGSYTVTVTDANSITAVKSFEITEPDVLSVSGAIINASPDLSDGKINLTVTGGTLGYTYLWSNSATTKNVSGLVPNNYSVVVTDARQCTASESFVVAESCPIPFQLEAQLISDASVKLIWNSLSGANSYQVRYRIVGATTWETQIVSDTFLTLTGLVPETHYEFQVKSHCSGSWSDYAGVSDFTTPPACDAPINVNTISVASNGTILAWDAFAEATSYMVRYKKQGTEAWSIQSTNTNSIELTGLEPLTAYEVIIQSLCGDFDSPFNSIFVFTTLQGCMPPSSIEAVASGYQGMTISWAAMDGVTLFSVRYRVDGTANWSSLNVSETSVEIQGLESGATYEYQVQSKCGVAWSEFSVAATVSLPTGCAVLAFQSIEVTEQSISVSWDKLDEATKYNVVYREAGTSGAWTAMVVTELQATLEGLEPNTVYEIYVQGYCTLGWGQPSTVLMVQTLVVGTQNRYKETSFLFYPNPAKENLIIEFSDQQAKSVHLLNVLGQVLLAEKAFHKMEIDVQSFEHGLYYIQVEYVDGHLELSKFIKE